MAGKNKKGSKLRKVWTIKPGARIKTSNKRKLLDRERVREAKDYRG